MPHVTQIPGTVNYAVSANGTIYSNLKGGVWRALIAKKPCKWTGYLRVNLRDRGVCRIHVLVLETFAGPRPPGMVARHLNGNKLDNRRNNLMWGTPAENNDDMRKHGRTNAGERSPFAKLTNAKVRHMRRLAAAGEHYTQLAHRFRVSPSVAWTIINNQSWKHLLPAH